MWRAETSRHSRGGSDLVRSRVFAGTILELPSYWARGSSAKRSGLRGCVFASVFYAILFHCEKTPGFRRTATVQVRRAIKAVNSERVWYEVVSAFASNAVQICHPVIENEDFDRSSPHQGNHRPSANQKTPKAERRMPTVNFNVFSGIRASGFRSARVRGWLTGLLSQSPRANDEI
jgi:hypothetical protein